MHTRGLTAIALLAALGLVAGCDSGSSTGDTSYRGGQVPAPDSSTVTREEQGEQDIAGADETAADRAGSGMTQPGQTGTADTGPAGQTMPGTIGEGPVGMTEFAALDTNSDGKLEEAEWQPEKLGGLEFQQIDEDSSGDIDREEFRQALASAGDAAREMMPDESDLNTLDEPATEE